MIARLAKNPQQFTRQLTILVGLGFALNLVLLVLAYSGSGEDETIARNRNITSLTRQIQQLREQRGDITFPSLEEAETLSIDVFNLAGEQEVEVLSFKTFESKEKLGDRELPILSSSIELQGEMINLLSFLSSVTQLGQQSTIIDSVEWKDRGPVSNLKFQLKTFMEAEQ